MGRKTYEEIGHPLPNRNNIVVSTTTNYKADNLITVKSLNEALEIVGNKTAYIIGGYNLFKEAIPLVDIMYITEIDLEIENGDVIFPEFDINEFNITEGKALGNEIKYKRLIYKRKK